MSKVPWIKERAFPYTRECVYLNTAATGLGWPGATEAAGDFYRRALGRGFDARSDWQAVADEVAGSVAHLLGDTSVHVDFFSSTSHALGLIAHSMQWSEDDEIVVAADEHPAIREVWYGAPGSASRVREVSISDESKRDQTLLESLSPRSRILAVSHVHSVTGARVDLQTLASACATNRTLLVVDGIQGVGAVPVDARNVDIYCASTFKWLMSGFGLAFMATSESARSSMRPAFRSYRNCGSPSEMQYSHVNYPALYVFRGALSAYRDHANDIYSGVAQLTARLKQEMLDAHASLITSVDPARSAGIVSLRLPSQEVAERVAVALSSRQISVATKGRVLRISPHFYNSDRDIDRLMEAWTEINTKNE